MNKKRKILIWFFLVLAIICLVCGGIVILMNQNGVSKIDDETNVGEKNTGLEYIKDYSHYNNFSVETSVDVVFGDGYEWNVDISAKVDVENEIINIESYDGNAFNYVYYVLKDKIHYYSSDGRNWEKNSSYEMILPDYSNIIDEIKSNKEVTDNGNNEFFLDYEYELDDGAIVIVPITVLFNQEGYLQQIHYDLTSIRSDYVKYIKTRSYSNINNTNVTVPDSIINNAIDGNETITLGF